MTTQYNNDSMSPEEKEEFIRKMVTDDTFRQEVCKQSLYWFARIYFPNFFSYEFADFHKEIMELLQDESRKRLVIAAFRGSGKSTLVTMVYVLWEVLLCQKKFVVIVSRTQAQARLHFDNIRRVLEDAGRYPLLIKDLGPFQEESDEWRRDSIVINNQQAKIMTASLEQGIRGSLFLEHRPQVIVLDDVEDDESVATKELRDKTYEKIERDIVPAVDTDNGRTITIGTVLHDDSIIRRYEDAINSQAMVGNFRKYPFINEQGISLWPAKFPTPESIEAERRKVSEAAWNFEYLLRPIVPEDQVIKPEWIDAHIYETLPDKKDLRYFVTGLDCAISQKETADFTALVSLAVYYSGKIYVLPNLINQRLDFPTTIKVVAERSYLLGDGEYPTQLVTEQVAFQETFAQQLRSQDIPIASVELNGMDKRERLSLVAPLFESGKVRFPKIGAEILRDQIIYFGRTKNDDLVDALTIALLYFLKQSRGGYTVPRGPYSPQPKVPDNWWRDPDLARKLEHEYELKDYEEQMQKRMRGY